MRWEHLITFLLQPDICGNACIWAKMIESVRGPPLDKMTGLGNLSLTYIAFMLSSFESDQGGGLVLENICGNTCIWAEMIQSVR